MKEVHQCSSCGGFCKKSGCERENDPPLVKFAKTAHLPPLPKTSTFQRFDGAKTVQAHTDAAMREYGALCRKQALEEAANLLEKAVQNINALSKSIANETAASALSYQATKIKGLMK